MYFGDAAVPTGEVMYTPMVFNPWRSAFYYIRVVGISVGKTNLSIDQSVFEIDPSGNGGTIIDSGTTLTYLQQEAYKKVAAVSSQFISAFANGQHLRHSRRKYHLLSLCVCREHSNCHLGQHPTAEFRHCLRLGEQENRVQTRRLCEHVEMVLIPTYLQLRKLSISV